MFRLLTTVLPILGALAAAGCSDDSAASRTIENDPILKAARDAIESDLKLRAVLTTEDHILPGQPIGLSLRLENTSTSKVHRVIKPGDGSTVGWREPHVYFSVQYQYFSFQYGEMKEEWVNLSQKPVMRCGLFDPNWAKDFTDIPAGGGLDLNAWLSSVHDRFEFRLPRTYRIYVHYDFGGIHQPGERRTRPDPIPPEVRDIPPFHLVSKPVQVTVERPIE